MARAFGFRGAVTVEEVIIRAGDTVTADGLLQDLPDGAGPFRAPSGALALYEATVRLPSRGLAPAALIPWAFGTAAALLGGMGLATWAAWRYHLAHLPQATAWRMGSLPMSSAPAQLSAPEIPAPAISVGRQAVGPTFSLAALTFASLRGLAGLAGAGGTYLAAGPVGPAGGRQSLL